jgi:hypothetical protein
MRKLILLVMTLAVLLTLAVVASAHNKHGGNKHGWKQGRRVRVVSFPRRVRPVRVVTFRRPAGVFGARYNNYGQRRSAFVHYRNAQRRALRRHQREEWRRSRWHHRAQRGRVRW